MALIRDCSSGQARILEAEHLIGRAPSCPLQLDSRHVSAQHAIVRWTGQHWQLKDLGSRNGTFLEGAAIRAGEGHRLRAGSKIAFGKREHEWELADDSPPVVMAVPVDGSEPVLIDGDFLALPSASDPQATIYRNSEGSWVIEQSDESASPIAHLQNFEVGGRVFRFCCPENIALTSVVDLPFRLEVRDLQLRFAVSLDEEHVELQVVSGGNTFDLGARSHNYLLLTLARHRLADAAEGHPETSCGWVYQDDLARDPSMAPPQLNIDVFRIRKQFGAIGVVDAGSVIERRPRTHQLRIGAGQLSVVTL